MDRAVQARKASTSDTAEYEALPHVDGNNASGDHRIVQSGACRVTAQRYYLRLNHEVRRSVQNADWL